MFLPERSIEDERAVRQAAFRKIEEWCQQLIQSDTVRQACIISVQEVQCGDPNCSPIDTIVTLSFQSGGTGMFALPMEPKDVTPDVLLEAFPFAEILEMWYRGEDAPWPPEPEPEPPELRFLVGTSVLCRVGATDWAPGRVHQLWYRENAWPEGAYAPYKIQLDDGRYIFAPQDVDQVIRLNSNNAM